MRQINETRRIAVYGALRMQKEGNMTGEEAVVLGFILAAFAVFGVTLGWVSSKSGSSRRGRSRSIAANDETRMLMVTRTMERRPSGS